jgi:hypothetical protein
VVVKTHGVTTRNATASAPARPFVGREAEFEELVAALGEARDGDGHVFFLTGEPGIGKTRLMQELTRLARERGWQVAAGRCWEEGGAPAYWPWIQAVRELGGDFERLSPGTKGSVDPETARFRLFDAAARFLVERSQAQPLVILLDDLHAADAASLVLMRFVGEAVGQAPLVLVGSYRERPRSSEAARAARPDRRGARGDTYRNDVDPHLSEIARHLAAAAPLGDADTAVDTSSGRVTALPTSSPTRRPAFTTSGRSGCSAGPARRRASAAASSCCRSATPAGAPATCAPPERASRRPLTSHAGWTTARCSPEPHWATWSGSGARARQLPGQPRTSGPNQGALRRGQHVLRQPEHPPPGDPRAGRTLPRLTQRDRHVTAT